MHKFSRFITEAHTPSKRLTIDCIDADDSLENLIRFIDKNGRGGHSFSIIVDDTEKFYWDGDGSDSITNIKREDLVRESIDKETIEKAAENIHDRWMDNQRKQGHDSHKSPDGKEEYMVDYDELSEPAKKLDRDAVHAVLDALKDAD